jgi:hypothetical protein
MKSQPKDNDVFATVNVSLLARRFREFREEELRKVAEIGARGTKNRSMKDMADAGIAAGRAQAFADVASIMDIVEDNTLKAKRAS